MKRCFAILMLALALGTTGWSQVILQARSNGPQSYTPPKLNPNPDPNPPLPKNIPAPPKGQLDLALHVNSRQQYTESVNISVRSVTTNTVDCVVEWWFFVQLASGGGQRKEHGSGNKQVTLAPLGVTYFRIDSPPWERIQGEYLTTVPRSFDYGLNRWRPAYTHRLPVVTGYKAGGYVVRVLVGNKVVGIEASSNDLKEQFKTVAGPK